MSEVKRYKVINGCLYFGEFGKQEGWSRLSGEAVNAADYARLEQECERLREEHDKAWRSAGMGQENLGVALNQAATLRDLLTRCKENLDPHRDAALWSDVCAALGPKP